MSLQCMLKGWFKEPRRELESRFVVRAQHVHIPKTN